MASWQESVLVGQSVWSESHKNGIVKAIDYQNDTVYCDHYKNGHQTYTLDDFFGCFDERLKQWIIIQI